MPTDTFFDTWKWPNRSTDTPTSTFDIPTGTTTIDVPSNMTSNFRNFSLEFLFSNVSSSDNGLVVRFYRANNVSAFAVPNIAELSSSSITLASSNTNNSTAVFVRDIKNLDNQFLRMIITAPSSVTANVVLNVKAGGLAR